MIRAILVVLCISLVLSGCTDNNFSNKKTETEDSDVKTYNNSLNEVFLGEWIATELNIIPRATLMANEYARKNSSIIGKQLVILKDSVLFDNQIFYISEISICDEAKLMSLFNISLGDAAKICGGVVLEETLTTTGKPINLVSLYTSDKQKHINIVIRNDDRIMLWVGEVYEYIGFYDLERRETQGDGSIGTFGDVPVFAHFVFQLLGTQLLGTRRLGTCLFLHVLID